MAKRLATTAPPSRNTEGNTTGQATTVAVVGSITSSNSGNYKCNRFHAMHVMATTQAPPDAMAHYRQNRQEYDTIGSVLSDVNDRFQSADRFTQKVMLWDATTYAVMSVQNDISLLRRAFQAYTQADTWKEVRDACKGVNYGNNKFRYIRHNFDVIFSSTGDSIIEEATNGNLWDAIELSVDHILGVSWIKAPFVFAMLGFQRVLCIDTNVAQMVPDESVKAKGYKSKEEYQNAMQKVLSEYPALNEELSPFMVQWTIFDKNRGNNVAKHEEWFEHILDDVPFGKQSSLNKYRKV